MKIKGMKPEEMEARIKEMVNGTKDTIIDLCVKAAMNPLIDEKFVGAETCFKDYGPIGLLIDHLSEGAAQFRVEIHFTGDVQKESAQATQKMLGLFLLQAMLERMTALLGAFAEAHAALTGESLDTYFEKVMAAHEAQPTGPAQ